MDCLPNDVLLTVIDTVRADDIEAFAVTCKHIHRLAQPRLKEHKAFRRRFSTVYITHDDLNNILVEHAARYTESHFTHPLDLVSAISKNPRIAEYVRFITYEDEELQGHGSSAIWAGEGAVSKIEEIARFLKTIPLFTQQPTELQKCLDGISDGSQAHAFVVLLVLCSDLEKLRLSSPVLSGYETTFEFFLAVQRSARLERVLPKLHTVESYRIDTEGETKLADLLIFSVLPSVRTLRSIHCGGDWGIDMDSISSRITRSSVEHIQMAQGSLPLDDLRALLKPMRKLISFKYGKSDDEMADLFAPDLVRVLEEAVRDTLRVLVFKVEDDNDKAFRPLKKFKHLRELEMPLDCLVYDPMESPSEDVHDSTESKARVPGLTEAGIPRLTDFLPESIEKVFLNFEENDEEAVAELFRDFAVSKERLLPILHSFEYAGEELLGGVKRLLRNAKVKVKRRVEQDSPEFERYWTSDPLLPRQCGV